MQSFNQSLLLISCSRQLLVIIMQAGVQYKSANNSLGRITERIHASYILLIESWRYLHRTTVLLSRFSLFCFTAQGRGSSCIALSKGVIITAAAVAGFDHQTCAAYAQSYPCSYCPLPLAGPGFAIFHLQRRNWEGDPHCHYLQRDLLQWPN